MGRIAPYINPIRVTTSDSVIDFDTILPSDDKMQLRENYQRGIYPAEFYPNFAKGETLILQAKQDLSSATITARFINAETGTYTAVTVTDITPTSWTGDEIHLFSVSCPTEGYFYMQVTATAGAYSIDFTTDIIHVIDWAEEKNLIEINYYDTQNRYGGYFFDSATQKWNPKAYYTGFLKKSAPEDDQSVFDGDDGDESIVQASPRRMWKLTISDVSDKYVDTIKQQSICDHFYVNGDRYAAKDFTIEETEKSDIVNVIMTLSLKDNDYLANI